MVQLRQIMCKLWLKSTLIFFIWRNAFFRHFVIPEQFFMEFLKDHPYLNFILHFYTKSSILRGYPCVVRNTPSSTFLFAKVTSSSHHPVHFKHLFKALWGSSLGCRSGCRSGCCSDCRSGCFSGCCLGCPLGYCLGCCLGCPLGCCLAVTQAVP